MPSVFHINRDPKQKPVTVNAGGKGEIPFSVTSATGAQLKGELKIIAKEPASKWLSLDAPAHREFSASATQVATVKIAVPPDAPPGKYSFHVNGYDVNDPDNNYTEGSEVSFEVAPPGVEPKKKFPWWILAVVAAVLVIALVAGWMFMQVSVPNVINKTASNARTQIEGASLKYKEAEAVLYDPAVTEDTVVDQDPRDGKRMRGSSVQVALKKGVVAQDFTGKNIKEAQEYFDTRLTKYVIKKQETLKPEEEGKVLSQVPTKGALKAADTVAFVVLARPEPIEVPRKLIGQDVSAVDAALKNVGLAPQMFQRDARNEAEHNKVVELNPPEGTPVQKYASVNVHYAVLRTTIPRMGQGGFYGLYSQVIAQLANNHLDVKLVRGSCNLLIQDIVLHPDGASSAAGLSVPWGTAVELLTIGATKASPPCWPGRIIYERSRVFRTDIYNKFIQRSAPPEK